MTYSEDEGRMEEDLYQMMAGAASVLATDLSADALGLTADAAKAAKAQAAMTKKIEKGMPGVINPM